MKKLCLAIMALLTMSLTSTAKAAPMAAPDDTEKSLEKLLDSNDPNLKLTAYVEIMNNVMKEDPESPISGIWIDDEYNTVVFAMNMDDETIDTIKLMPKTFKTAILHEISGDDDMTEFLHLIGSTGHSLDFFIKSTTTDDKSAIIDITPEELLNIK